MKYIEITHVPLISEWRKSTGFLRATAGTIVFFFLWLNVHPALAAVKDEFKHPTLTKTAAQTPALPEDPHFKAEAKLRDALASLNQSVKPAHDLVIKRTRKGKKGEKITDITIIGTPEVPAIQKQQHELEEIAQNLKEADQETLQAFDGDAEHIRAHHLPQMIMDRHDKAVEKFKVNAREVQEKIKNLESTTNAVALYDGTNALLDRLRSYETKPAPFDPKNLPFKVETEKARPPKLTEKELKGLFRNSPSLKTSFLESKDPLQVASVGSMAGLVAASAVTPPGPEFLAPTIDVQITPAIQQLATQLHNNPVEIYNWVHNNIEWLPTYGSVQGSAMTLDKKAGNAFDISNLLIALLRASNIPAQYVYGTIQVPVDRAMNWAGGFTSPDAMQSLLATGGIPNNALTSGGQSVALLMEHIWVEAFVDFYPSRGAKNLHADTWVPMDASFKQYSYTQGMSLQQNVPFDAQGFLNAAQQGATIDSTNGFVQNLNQANIQTQLTNYQQQVQTYINNQNPNATVRDVLGSKSIVPTTAAVLAAGLPYKLVARGNAYSTLPDGLRHKFQYSLYEDGYQLQLGNPIFSYTEATPNLAGRKITLTFVPASDQDRQTIASYLPQPHADGSPIQPSEFPSSLPAYSIHVTAELRIDGQRVASGGSYTLGTQLLGEGGFTRLYNLNDWDLTQEMHLAGATSALGLSLQGISDQQMSSLNLAINAEIQQSSVMSVRALAEDLLTAVVWSYFLAVQSEDRQSQRPVRVASVMGMSYGFFHSTLTPVQQYGVITRATLGKFLADIGHQRRVSYSLVNNAQDWATYNFVIGQRSSALESVIPEQLLGAAAFAGPPQSISSASGLAAAESAGQAVYTFGPNRNNHTDQIQQSASVTSNVQDALAAGRIVIVHKTPISVAGFNGAGYVIVDPTTGGGSYLIEGGAGGGAMIFLIATMFMEMVILAGASGNFLGVVMISINFVTTFAKISKICRDRTLTDAQAVSEVQSLIDIALTQALLTLVTPYALKWDLGFAANLAMISTNLFLIRALYF